MWKYKVGMGSYGKVVSIINVNLEIFGYYILLVKKLGCLIKWEIRVCVLII